MSVGSQTATRKGKDMGRQPIEQLEHDWAALRILSGDQCLEKEMKDLRRELADLRTELSELKGLVKQSISDGWIRQDRANRTGDMLAELAPLVGPVGIPLPDGTVLTKSLYGQLYFADSDDVIITPHLLI